MCGIIGYVGTKEVTPLLVSGLQKLEYRGYDSAGIYIPQQGTRKALGNIAQLEEVLDVSFTGTSGIAHTRWATHGEPSVANAHPHSDQRQLISLVHNGIIENYSELKKNLIAQGVHFNSETDSEVVAHLIARYYEGNLEKAVAKALKHIVGAYGIAVMSVDNPDQIVVARLGSPLVVARTEHGVLVSSDPVSLISHTKELVYLEDYEMAVLEPTSYTVQDFSGRLKTPTVTTLDTEETEVKKDGFPHYMKKEIFAIPQVIQDSMRGRIEPTTGKVTLGGLASVASELKRCRRITIVGCGSAYYAALAGKYLIEQYARIPVTVELASEYRYKTNWHEDNEVLIAVSQSGETADTLEAVKQAKKQGLLTLGIVNVVGSSIARETTAGVYNHAGPEIAVASTKAFVSQLVVFVLLALKLKELKCPKEVVGKDLVDQFTQLPTTVATLLKSLDTPIQKLAKSYADYPSCIFIGRNVHSPIAAEGALKLKEVSYLHAEAYPGGELKHGPLALVSPEFPVIALAPEDDLFAKMMSNIEEVKARKSPILLVTTTDSKDVRAVANDVVVIPKTHNLLQPIVSVLPLHLLAYYIGTERGVDVDKPRNLAKSVTVE
jgi:glucosamine--fructose-6-phosphate aminotransferase (isomerizing)